MEGFRESLKEFPLAMTYKNPHPWEKKNVN
jgi:hypothetical protein